MERRRLGAQGLEVSAQGLGCMGMSEFYGHTDWDESVATIHRALELGVTFLDTGALASDWSDSGIAHVRVAVGFGIRVVIPFLGNRPVAFDFGFPLAKFDGDESRVLSFSFGSNF